MTWHGSPGLDHARVRFVGDVGPGSQRSTVARPASRSASIIAAAVPLLSPHMANPVATSTL